MLGHGWEEDGSGGWNLWNTCIATGWWWMATRVMDGFGLITHRLSIGHGVSVWAICNPQSNPLFVGRCWSMITHTISKQSRIKAVKQSGLILGLWLACRTICICTSTTNPPKSIGIGSWSKFTWVISAMNPACRSRARWSYPSSSSLWRIIVLCCMATKETYLEEYEEHVKKVWIDNNWKRSSRSHKKNQQQQRESRFDRLLQRLKMGRVWIYNGRLHRRHRHHHHLKVWWLLHLSSSSWLSSKCWSWWWW